MSDDRSEDNLRRLLQPPRAPGDTGGMSGDNRSMLGRAFLILGSFTSERPQLSQSELSRCTGLPLPTVHRLCRQLVDNGALERVDNGHYEIGVRLWELGALAPRAHGLRQVALPYLEDLYEATRENVQLVVREDLEALCIERLSRAGPSPSSVGRAGDCRYTHRVVVSCCWRSAEWTCSARFSWQASNASLPRPSPPNIAFEARSTTFAGPGGSPVANTSTSERSPWLHRCRGRRGRSSLQCRSWFRGRRTPDP